MCTSTVIDFIMRKNVEKNCYCENCMPNQINCIKQSNILMAFKGNLRTYSNDSKQTCKKFEKLNIRITNERFHLQFNLACINK